MESLGQCVRGVGNFVGRENEWGGLDKFREGLEVFQRKGP